MAASGTLQARAFASNAQLPLPGVAIRITGQPFTQVDLSAECPGYEQILVEGIQVFAGVRTIQELAMIPYPQYPEYYNLTEVFPISPQAL